MGELRKDYLLERYVIISDTRKDRPHDFHRQQTMQNNSTAKNNKVCCFCPGNEHLTTKEIMHIGKDGKWIMRVIPNKFQALELKGKSTIVTDNKYYTYSDNYGQHEIIVETDRHSEYIFDYSKEHLVKLLHLYKARILVLSNIENIKYIQVIKNHGKDAGASIEHSHSQILAYNMIPTLIQQKEETCKVSDNTKYKCAYCEIIQNEKDSYRQCFENNSFVAFTPYASRFAYEIILFSKQHKLSLIDFTDAEIEDLAAIMQKILAKLKQLGADFNFYFQNGIKNMHFHVEFAPRINTFAGFEFATETIINTIYPEDAAKWYRGE
jgi:UDPglucose--hexose-1-phosphate uridylyltransferase